MSGLRREFLIASLICGAVALPAMAAPPPNGRHKIANAHSGLCLSPAGGTSNRNEQTVQFTCDADQSRTWTIEPVEGNVVKIRNVKSQQCLTVAGGGSDRNTPSVQFPCDNDPSRRWVYSPDNAGLFRLVNLQSGLCLTIAGGSTGNNDVAVQFPCDADPSRFFRLAVGSSLAAPPQCWISGHSLSARGRKAWEAGMVATTVAMSHSPFDSAGIYFHEVAF